MDPFERAKTHFLTGLGLLKQGDLPQAESEFQQSLALLPERQSTLINLSACLIQQKKIGAARALVQRALELDPGAADAWVNLGLIANADEEHQQALQHFDKAITIDSNNADAWNNRGAALDELQRHEEAIDSYRHAISIHPHHSQAWANQGVAWVALGEDQEALACFQKAIEYQPDNMQTRWSLSKLLTTLQGHPVDWEAYESRWQISEPPKLQSSKPLWTGQRSAQPLLLWGEQGIGDQILYASILPDLANFPQRKLLAVDPRLHPLFARSMPEFELLDLDNISDALPFTEHLPLGSLPRYFRHSSQDFAKARTPFLSADPGRSAELRTRLAEPGQLVCGVSWSSNRKKYGPGKTLGLDAMLAPLADLPLKFVNLQYGDTSQERFFVKRTHGAEVLNVAEIDNFNDLDGLAALIEACDIVLTISNSTAHLAGALGKHTLLMVPNGRSRFWYWTERNGRNPWYPSATLFSQVQPNSWEEPLQSVRQHLLEIYGT